MLAHLKSLWRKPAPDAAHLALGRWGERQALAYLCEAGFRIVATNYRVPLGRGQRGQKVTGEIDIIAYEEGTLVFIEVKTRSSDEWAAPERAVDLRKQRQIARAAHRYRQLLRLTGEPRRYDVVTVLPTAAGNKITLHRGFFDERRFGRGRFFQESR